MRQERPKVGDGRGLGLGFTVSSSRIAGYRTIGFVLEATELPLERTVRKNVPKPALARGRSTGWLRITGMAILALQVAAGACSEPNKIVLEGHSFPQRWHIQFFDDQRKDLGSIDVHFTVKEGRSCLGSKSGKSFLIVVDRRTRLSPMFKVTESPALSFDGAEFVIDLTGGICDDYVLMKGTIPTSGVAAGKVSTLGWNPPQTIATFKATPNE
jgi:hypothetical protein